NIPVVVLNYAGFTTLHLAIVKSRNEVAKLLISELGAKGMGAVSETGITAAHVAASSGNVEVLKMIASKNKKFLTQETADGTTPLYFAAQEGRLATLKYLHEKTKCDLSSRSNDGRKPIHAACQCGHTHIVKYIVSQLSNHVIFDTVPDGATTLHFASSTGQMKTAKWLIDSDVAGTLVTSKDNNGDTPAHDAADNGKIEMLKLLLESGADLYAVNSDGNTPYSLALSSQEPGVADFVVKFASNAPQKQTEGPSQMTIFNMQGEVDVVDLPATVTVEAEIEETSETHELERSEVTTPGKKEDKKSKKKEKEKKKKQKDKKGKKNGASNSFLAATGAALLAIPSEENGGEKEVEKVVSDHKILDMTEEELDMFQGGIKTEEGEIGVAAGKAPASGSEDGEIVVSYEEKSPPVKSKLAEAGFPDDEPMSTQEYMTVSEMEKVEKKKKKKMGRKNSKSIHKQKHEHDSAKNVEGAGEILSSGSQMGFKSKFRTNPLLRMGGAAPPTPPPTPATGFSSSAPSEAGMVSTEDEDEVPYDAYAQHMASEDPPAFEDKASSEEKEEGEEEEEENKEDTEEMMPEATDTQENTDDEEEEEEDVEEEEEGEEDRKPVLKKWPPPKEKDYKPPEAKLEPSGVSVLKKWQPPTPSDNKPTTPTLPGKPEGHGSVLKKWQPPTPSDDKPTTPTLPGKPEGRGHVLKKWPPATASSEPKSSSPKDKSLRPVTKTPSPLTIPPPTPTVTLPLHSDEEEKKSLPVRLNPVKREDLKSPKKLEDENKDTELSKIKLKKAAKAGAKYSSPSIEVTSGAGNELSALLKLRQNKI
ncbi:Espin, partial [Geodia barretti]